MINHHQHHPCCAREKSTRFSLDTLCNGLGGSYCICLLIPGVGAASSVTYSEVATVSGTLAGQNFVSNMITAPAVVGRLVPGLKSAMPLTLAITFVFGNATFSAVVPSSVTPLPAALPLFATGIGGLGLLGWRRKRKAPAGVA
jgi:hypothetical protein